MSQETWDSLITSKDLNNQFLKEYPFKQPK